MGVIFMHNTGKALNTSNTAGRKMTYITTSNLYWDRFELDSLKEMYFSESEIEKCSVRKGDLLVCEGGDIGRAAVWKNEDTIRIQNHIHKLRPYVDIAIYYFYYLFYYYKNQNLIDGKGIGIQGLSSSMLHAVLVPLPSYKEQFRIVEQVKRYFELLEYIDNEKLDLFNAIQLAKFKILDLAIRGKLVPQDPNDEPASVLLECIRAEKEDLIKQGKIKRDKKESVIFRGEDNSYYEKIGQETRCIDDELPFEIPLGWEWARLGNCCIKEIKRGKSPVYSQNSSVLVFAQKCNTKYDGIDLGLALYLDETTLPKYPLEEYMCDLDIVINSTGTGTLGRVGIYRSSDNPLNIRLVPDSHVTVIRTNHSFCAKYIYAFLKVMQPELEKLGEGSTNQKELKPASIKDFYIPIPPITEQIRISNFVDMLINSLDKIEKDLS